MTYGKSTTYGPRTAKLAPAGGMIAAKAKARKLASRSLL
jgi:hypothetical protein